MLVDPFTVRFYFNLSHSIVSKTHDTKFIHGINVKEERNKQTSNSISSRLISSVAVFRFSSSIYFCGVDTRVHHQYKKATTKMHVQETSEREKIPKKLTLIISYNETITWHLKLNIPFTKAQHTLNEFRLMFYFTRRCTWK